MPLGRLIGIVQDLSRCCEIDIGEARLKYNQTGWLLEDRMGETAVSEATAACFITGWLAGELVCEHGELSIRFECRDSQMAGCARPESDAPVQNETHQLHAPYWIKALDGSFHESLVEALATAYES